MSAKTKKQRVKVAAPAVPEERSAAWPAEFAAPRTAVLIGLCFFLFSLVIFGLASVNGLLWFKRLMGVVAGLDGPGMLPLGTHSWDAALLLWGFGLLLCAALIHPVLGLGVLLLFRTPLDGYTYPTDNMYFVWAIVLLVFVQGWRVFYRGAMVRAEPLPLLLLAFFLVAWMLSPASFNFDATYRQLVLWFSYFLLLLLVINVVQEQRVFKYLVLSVCVALGLQAIYSVLHFYYMLPYMRQMIMAGPEAQRAFFGTDITLSPEFIRRLNINRAFGTMLFPNALSGYLVLCLPLTACSAWAVIRALRASRGRSEAPRRLSDQLRYQAAAAACVTWFFTVVLVFSMVQFTVEYAGPGLAWYHDPLNLSVLVALLGLLPGGLAAYLVVSHGLHRAGLLFAAWLLPLVAIVSFWALWLTYSRGALLALAAAVGVGAILALLRQRSFPLRTAVSALLLAGVAGAAVLAALFQPRALAQDVDIEAPRPAAHEALTEAGFDPTVQELLDPQSFRLRLSYWNVGGAMFRANWLTGVGLGNFGEAYAQYQYLGAGDVKEAHNSFLQAFSETGLLGGVLFAAFWAWFLIWGLLRVWKEPDTSVFLILIGLYVGILAFLLHAFIDIHFSHPSLVMFAMVITGLFLSYARLADGSAAAVAPPVAEAPRRPLLVYAVLVMAALAAGAAARPYLHDLALSRVSFFSVGADTEKRERLRAAQVFLDEAPRQAEAGEGQVDIAFAQAYSLIPDAGLLASFGDLFAPMPGTGRWRRLGSTEPIPQASILRILRPAEAYAAAMEYAPVHVRELERIDARYGHDPELAVHISIWCEYITRHAVDEDVAETRALHAEKMLAWAEEAVRRGPRTAETHAHLGQMRWDHAYLVAGDARRAGLELALEAFEKAASLSPLVPQYLEQLARALEDLGTSSRDEIPAEARADFLLRAEDVRARAEQLRQDRRMS